MNIGGNLGIQNPALQNLQDQVGNAAKKGPQSDDFAETLMDALKEVNESQANAKQVGNDFMAGRQGTDVKDVMIAMERASIAMNLTMQVRNKMLEAYQEITRMQI